MATGTSVTSCLDCIKELDKISLSRYKEKLQYNMGPNSCLIHTELKADGATKRVFGPTLDSAIFTYLIATPGIYTKESMKAFKSLEAYQFFLY